MSGQSLQNLFHEGRLSVITFSTRDATFAIPLEQVRYIEKDVERNIKVDQHTNFNHEVITYQERAIPLYDFCSLTGSTSALAFGEKLLETLNNLELQQTEWFNSLEDSLKSQTPFTKSIDPDKSEFGMWYHSFKTDDEDLAEVLEKFDAPHKKLHSVAAEMLEISQNDQEQALTRYRRERNGTFAQLLRLFENARERVYASIRPIIVFVDQGNNKISALRLDNIKDIENYGMEDFSNDESTEGIMQRKQEEFKVEGYLRNGNKAPFILINCQPYSE